MAEEARNLQWAKSQLSVLDELQYSMLISSARGIWREDDYQPFMRGLLYGSGMSMEQATDTVQAITIILRNELT